MLKFQPSRFRRAMSVPTCTPANVSCCLLAQLTVPVRFVASGAGAVSVTADPELLLMLTSPPTPRTHTPPPCSFGPAPPGLETNALVWFDRNAVLTLAMVADTELDTDAPNVANGPNPVMVFRPAGMTQFCAQAPEEANSATAKAL